MKTFKVFLFIFLRESVGVIFLLASVSLTSAADIFWTGPPITFSHTANTSTSDMLTTNHVGGDAANNVWLTRGTEHPLYNAAAESSWNGSTSPLNTVWALAPGDITNPAIYFGVTNAASLTYGTFATVVGQPGNSPRNSINKTFYVKIVSDNIYLTLKLTAWGNNNGGSFTYERSTPAPAVAPSPTISITNPAGGNVFAAPANVNIAANAAVSSGTVTNVQFFANGTSIGSDQTAPFSITANNLAAGSYALTAVATAAGISATSSVVSVTMVNPTAINLSEPQINGGKFSFNYTANPGLAYVIQVSTNLAGWSPLTTNVASGSPVVFTHTISDSIGTISYRVGRLPNP